VSANGDIRIPRNPRCTATMDMDVLGAVRGNGLPNTATVVIKLFISQVTRIGLGACMQSSATLLDLGRRHAAPDH
jgi:hypothetical protein